MSRPRQDEAAQHYFTYIDRISDDDIVSALTGQLQEVPTFLSSISEQESLHRYAPEKWSIRQVLNHVSDTERAFAFRALWFGRGFNDP
ncbi:MAG: DinB family protein, partial [Candidatus Acidiferrales bacterium]